MSSFFLLTACDGWNSELKVPSTAPPSVNQKPICNFKAQDNCWIRSIDLLRGCLPSPEIEGVFTDDLEFCSTAEDEKVIFKDSLEDYVSGKESLLEFNVYKGSRTCFHFVGNKNYFRIDQENLGFMEFQTLDDGDVEVSCFSGQKFIVPFQAKEKGCRGEKANTTQYIPSALLSRLKGQKLGYQFQFTGLGQDAATVFQCREADD